jgi:antitoxin YefM
MNTMSYSKLRKNLKSALDQVAQDHEVIRIERAKGGDVVLVSSVDYDALAETAYLLRSPANARRLMESALRPRIEQRPLVSLIALKDEVGL